MRASRARVLLVVCAVVTGVATVARADGECFKGYRDTTPAERAAMMSVLETALDAMPPAPDGWVVASDDTLYVTPRVCRDHDSVPWRYDFSRKYDRVDDRDARTRILDDAAAHTSADMTSKQPRMDAVMERIQELSEAAVAAAEKGDYDTVDAINAEIQEASAEMERIMEEGGTLDRIDEATDAANLDTTIAIIVDVNSGHGLYGYGAEPTAVPPGADGAYRWTDTEGSNVNETRMVLFGRWRTDGEAFDPVFRDGAAPTAAQVISIRITADESRIASVVDAFDFSALAAAVAR